MKRLVYNNNNSNMRKMLIFFGNLISIIILILFFLTDIFYIKGLLFISFLLTQFLFNYILVNQHFEIYDNYLVYHKNILFYNLNEVIIYKNKIDNIIIDENSYNIRLIVGKIEYPIKGNVVLGKNNIYKIIENWYKSTR